MLLLANFTDEEIKVQKGKTASGSGAWVRGKPDLLVTPHSLPQEGCHQLEGPPLWDYGHQDDEDLVDDDDGDGGDNT